MTNVRSTVPRAGSVPEQAALVPLPPKARRRWGLFAAGVLVTCLGVLGSVWLYQSTTTAVSVVAASHTIERGQKIDRNDLVVVHVEKDPALRTVSGDDLDSLVGQRALFDVAEGSLLTPQAVGETSLPGRGMSVIAVPVGPALVPTGLMAGDDVRFVPVGSGGQSGASEPVAAQVVEVRPASSDSSKVVVEVTVPDGSAAALAALVGNDVAVILDSRDR